MGNKDAVITARVSTRARGRAHPASALSPDPSRVFAVAPIQVAAERRVRAVAYGDPEGEPQVITLWDPLGRGGAALGPFAAALDAYLTSSLAGGRVPRVWVAHGAALELLGLLGERCRRNRTAGAPLRRLGWLCHALAAERQCAGQQVVAVALDLLRSHGVTGQSAAEDQPLNWLLARVNPAPSENPAEAADRPGWLPAPATLDRESADRIEELRRAAKRCGPQALAARAEIEARLFAGALNEWGRLVDARAAFRRLGLPPLPGLEDLEAESGRRIAAAVIG
jgi:hypothetical protein